MRSGDIRAVPPSGSLSSSTFLLPALSVVLGGARSGKSRIAERLVTAAGKQRVYIATAQAFDDEMAERISQHQKDRGADWQTREAPLDLEPVLASCTDENVVLIDCATLWLSNHLLNGSDLTEQSQLLLSAVAVCRAPVVVVSNEVGWGIVPENRLAREFRDAQGRLNQALAAQADLVLGVMGGLPFALKGRVPDGLT